MRLTKYAAVFAIAAFCLAIQDGAAKVLIDFGSDATYASASATSPDGNGNYWNSTTYGNYMANLVDTTNGITTIDLAIEKFNGVGSYNGPAGITDGSTPNLGWTNAVIDEAALGDLGIKEAAFDFYTSNNAETGDGRLQIQQLNPNQAYKLTFFSSHKYGTATQTMFTCYSDSNYTARVGTATLTHGDGGDGHNSNTVAVISGVAGPSNPNNILYLKWEGVDVSTEGYINSMSIEAVDYGTEAVTAPEIRSWLLDLGSSLVMTSPHGDGNYWNTLDFTAYSPGLVDITNGASSLAFGPAGGAFNNNFNGPDGAVEPVILADLGGNTGGIASNAVNDYIQATSSAGRFQLQGLSASKYYRLSFFSSHKFDEGGLTGTTTISAGANTNYVGNATVTAEHNDTNINAQNWVANNERLAVLNNVQPNANGIIYVEFTGWLNCMKIEESDTPFPELGGGTKVLFDIGSENSNRGVSIAGYDENGNLWNSVYSGAYFEANRPKDSAIPTTLGFGWVSGYVSGNDSYNGPAGATDQTNILIEVLATDIDGGALGDLGAIGAAFDWYGDGYVPIATNRIVLVQCPTDKYYQIDLFGSHKYDSGTGSLSTYNILDMDGSVIDTVELAHGDGGANHNRDTVATLNNLQAQPDGRIYLEWIGYLNAFSVEVTDDPVDVGPEPEVPTSAAVLIDFGIDGNYRTVNAPSPDQNGNYWNLRGFSSLFNMVDTNNTATTLDLVTTTAYGVDSYNGPAGDTSGGTDGGWDWNASTVTNTAIDAVALGDLGVTNAAYDFFSGTVAFELRDCDPDKNYNLIFFSSHKYDEPGTTTYEIHEDGGYSNLLLSATLAHNDFTINGNAWAHNQDRVAIISNVIASADNTIYVQYSGYLNAMKIEEFDPGLRNTNYADWASDYGLVQDRYGDDDNDGISNIREYATNGDPTNGTPDGLLCEFYLEGTNMVYVHPLRVDDEYLSYYLEFTDNLVTGEWVSAGSYTVTGTNDMAVVPFFPFNYVTNEVQTTEQNQFFRMGVDLL